MKYKVGDRIFYEYYNDSTIGSSIVIEVKDESYLDDRGRKRPYQWLTLWRDGNCSSGIESYNCLSPNDPKVKELAKRYAKFDKEKDSIINSIMKIISPFDKDIQKDIIDLLKVQINYDR